MKNVTKEISYAMANQTSLSVLQMELGEVLEVEGKEPYIASGEVTVLVREYKKTRATSSCEEILQIVETHNVWQGRTSFKDCFRKLCEKKNLPLLVLPRGAMPLVSKDMFLIPATEKKTSWYVIRYAEYCKM